MTASPAVRHAATPARVDGLITDVVLLSAARMTAAGLSAVTAVVLARSLTKSEFGQLAVLTGIVGFAVVLADAGLTSSTARYLSEGRASGGLFVRVVALRGALASTAALGILAYGAAGGAPAFGAATMLAAVLLLANSTVSLAHGILPTLRRVRAAAVLTIVVPSVELAGILLAARSGLTGPVALAATTVAAGLGAVISVTTLLKNRYPSSEPVTTAAVMRYAVPLFGVTLCVSALGVLDLTLIALFHDAATAAPYALGWKLVMFLHLPAVAIAVVVAPRLAQDRAAAPQLFGRWIQRTAVLNAGILAVVAALAPQIIVIFGDQYRHNGTVLQALMGYAAVLGLAPLVSIACNFLGGARARLPVTVAAVVVNIVLDLVLIPKWGPYGAALSATLAYLVYVVGHARLAGRLLNATVWPGGIRLALRIAAAAATAVLLASTLAHGLDFLGPVGSGAVATAVALCGYLGVVGIGALR